MKHNKYPAPMVILHYIVAVLMITTYLLDDAMFWHKSFGVLVLSFGVLRLLVRLMYIGKTPASINPPKSLAYKLEKSVHGFLYLIMLFTPMIGWALSNAKGYPVSLFGWFELPTIMAESYTWSDRLEGVHELLANAFMALLIAHVGAAVLHMLKERVNVIKRMWF